MPIAHDCRKTPINRQYRLQDGHEPVDTLDTPSGVVVGFIVHGKILILLIALDH